MLESWKVGKLMCWCSGLVVIVAVVVVVRQLFLSWLDATCGAWPFSYRGAEFSASSSKMEAPETLLEYRGGGWD